MKPTAQLICRLGAVLLCATPAGAQQQQAVPIPPMKFLPVYVVDFQQSEPIREIGDLGSFTTSLVDLRLLEISSVTVRRVSKEPACGNAQPRDNAVAVQGALVTSTVAPSGDFYVVHGSIEVRLPDIVLDYSVDKCENQTLQTVLQDTQPFTLDHAREELTIAAHAIGYKIERITPPTQVAVELFQIEGDVQDPKNVQETMRSQVIQAMSKTPEIAVTGASDYRVEGKITFQKAASLLRLVPLAKTMLQADLHIEAHGKPYPMRPLTSSRADLEKFYSDVAEEVRRILPQVLLAEHLGLPQILGNMKVDELLTRGSQLLDQCPQREHDCANAQYAIPLLSAATQQESKSWRAFWLLGQAQVLAGKYADASGSLKTSTELVKQEIKLGKFISPGDQSQVFSLLGDAYRSVEKYVLAEAAYDESLGIVPSQPELYLSKALALRFDGKRLQSLQTLLEGFQAAVSETAAQSAHASLKDVVRTLENEDFDKAEELLARSFRAGRPVADEYAFLLVRKWEAYLDANWNSDGRKKAKISLQQALDARPSDPDVLAELYANLARTQFIDGDRQALDSFLTRAEQLPADQVSENNREWIERIRARDYIDHSEYEKGYTAADAAFRIKPSTDGSYLAALGRVFYAMDLEKNSGGNATSAQKSELTRLYQQSADLLAPLVARRQPDGDISFTIANHYLGRDVETRKQFESFVKADPKDVSALSALMFVCSQYLLDANCAFSAAQKYAGLQNPRGEDATSAYLNAAEVALIAGKEEAAREWLSIAINQPHVEARDESLAYIYRLWLAMRGGQTAELAKDFQTWQVATQQFRQTNLEIGWVFLGARQILKKDRIGESHKQLLAAMMDALEDRSRPLPPWPGLGAH